MDIAKYIDHAILKPTHTDEDLKRECEIAKKYEVATVCVKPYHVRLAREFLKGSVVETCTVIGFPHGSNNTETKVQEAIEAISDGAAEVDMVVNIGKVLDGDYEYVKRDIQAVVDTAHSKGAIAKVIFENCYLNEMQKITLCQICSEVEADYVKTSTGFGTGGATIEDILLMKRNIYNGVKIKASGGIKTKSQAEEFLKAGCQRLGLSSTKEILEGINTKSDDY